MPREMSQNVQRAADSLAAAVEHVGVDHCGLDALVAEDLLDGPDVIAAREQVGREGVPQGVDGRVLGDSHGLDGSAEGSLELSLVEMVPPDDPGARIPGPLGRRENVLPGPLGACSGILSGQGVREADDTVALGSISLMEALDGLEVLSQGGDQGLW